MRKPITETMMKRRTDANLVKSERIFIWLFFDFRRIIRLCKSYIYCVAFRRQQMSDDWEIYIDLPALIRSTLTRFQFGTIRQAAHKMQKMLVTIHSSLVIFSNAQCTTRQSFHSFRNFI